MAINFPDNPSNGDTHQGYTYNSTKGTWTPSASAGTEPPVILTEPPTTVQGLNSDGTTSTVTMTAQDPDGFDITYGIAYKTAGNALPAQLASAPSINQTTGVYTFTPTTTESNAGSFRARLSASDGVSFTTRLVDFNLVFTTPITFSSSEPGISTDLSNSIAWSTSSLNASSGGAQSANLRTGKYYFEIDIASCTTTTMVGICPESITNPGYNTTGCQSVYATNGNWYPGASSSGSIGGYGAGDVLMIAYDTTARQMWAGKNGTWGVDPSTTGKTIGGTGEMTLYLSSGSSSGANMTATLILGTSNLNYTVPAGFSAH